MYALNTQQLLFDQTPLITKTQTDHTIIPTDFYSNGYTILDKISDADQALITLESFIGNIDPKKAPLYRRFTDRIQLAKADLIPVCDDSVETSFQALHFDMGQPFVSDEDQSMYLVIGLYFPNDDTPGDAKTRVISLKSLLADPKWGGTAKVEREILSYVNTHGDGWDEINTRRLSCFARIIDAISNTTDLADYRDKTMAQWFRDPQHPDGQTSLKKEHQFYLDRGLDISKVEKQITLQPGQLLIIDNTRTAHGRIGKRHEKEIYQFMYGVKAASPEDIDTFRQSVVKELTT